jgi:mRNA-degrading endonuclease RelE of RelBE toxin-antitoxin system
MRLLFTPHFTRAYNKAPEPMRRAFDRQALLLLENPRHPSLRVKKYNEAEDKWQGRVNQDWRFYFRIVGDAYILTDIIRHPK